MAALSPILTHLPPRQLAVSSWCWAADFYAGRFSLLDLPVRAAAAGFQLVEANDFMLPPPRFSRVIQPLTRMIPRVNPELWRYQRQTLVRFKHLLDQAEVQCVCWTLNSDFSEELSGPIGRSLYEWWGLSACDILSVSRLRIIAGGGSSEVDQWSLEKVVERMSRFVKRGLDRLPDLTIVFENHWGLSTDIDTHLAIFRKVRDRLPDAIKSRFALCLDPTNLDSPDPQPLWEKMAPDATHIHLKVRGERQPIDLPALIELINNAHRGSFNGVYVVEGQELLRS